MWYVGLDLRFHLIKGIFRCRLNQENVKKSKTFLSNLSVWNSVGLFRFLDQETCCTVSRFLISWLIRLWVRLIWDFLCYFSSTQFAISESWSKLVRLFFYMPQWTNVLMQGHCNQNGYFGYVSGNLVSIQKSFYKLTAIPQAWPRIYFKSIFKKLAKLDRVRLTS